ncbi:MAG: S8 family serine peptidase [Sphingomonadales bacterium]|nr:S8 family serine peptidase [Sphingomonadales bacterium]
MTSEYNRSDGAPYHGAIAAWQAGANGQGVTLAIIDSGIDTASPEFAGRIAPSSADVAGSRGLVNADSDHGTRVALTAAAARDNTGVLGIAWASTIQMLRADTPGTCATFDANVKDSGCKFDDTDIAAGVDKAIAGGAKVINISLGGSAPASVMTASIARAAAAGIVVVVSAGNDGDSTDPKIDPNNPDPFAAGLRGAGNGNVIIAGSVTNTGAFSTFSNRAGAEQQWFLSALGEKVCCVYENGVLKVTTDPSGQRFVTLFSGTSFSAPQIAGAAALLRQAFPNLTAAQVVDLLLRTARDAGAPGIDATYGRGILDITSAFAPQGATSIAGTGSVVPLSDTVAVASTAMGDATSRAALSTVMLDSYQRAYTVNLGGSLRGAPVVPRLAPALAGQVRNVSGGNGPLAMAFSVDARGRAASLPWSGQLRLSRADSDTARVLAARVIARLSPHTSAAFAYAQGADGLVAQLQGQSRAAFLVATDPLADLGFERGGETALALRRSFGRWGLTLSTEAMQAAAAAPIAQAEAFAGTRRHDGATRFALALDRRFGALDAMLGASWLGEQRTVLGAQLHDGFGARGADSLFLDAALGWQAAEHLRLGAAWRQGYTHARIAGLVAGGSTLRSNGWALDVARTDLFQPGDSLALRVSQPLRVARGGLNLNLPSAWSYDTLTATTGLRRLSLAPTGREVTGELAWRGALWGGAASASLYLRKDPGHYARLPNDKGVALSWATGF